jgi:hypothetical protein
MKIFLLLILFIFLSSKSFSETLYLKCVEQDGYNKDYTIHFKILNKEEVFYRSSSLWKKWCKRKPTDEFKILDDGFSCHTYQKGEGGLNNKLILDVFLKKLTVYIKSNDKKLNMRRKYKCEVIK